MTIQLPEDSPCHLGMGLHGIFRHCGANGEDKDTGWLSMLIYSDNNTRRRCAMCGILGMHCGTCFLHQSRVKWSCDHVCQALNSS